MILIILVCAIVAHVACYYVFSAPKREVKQYKSIQQMKEEANGQS